MPPADDGRALLHGSTVLDDSWLLMTSSPALHSAWVDNPGRQRACNAANDQPDNNAMRETGSITILNRSVALQAATIADSRREKSDCKQRSCATMMNFSSRPT